jgi:hypothetical protein
MMILLPREGVHTIGVTIAILKCRLARGIIGNTNGIHLKKYKYSKI